MQTKMQDLKARLLEISDLNAAAGLLYWDQSTYMPPGGTPARARQMATLRRLTHERATDPALGGLLEALRPYEESLPHESDEASLIRVTRREYERAVQIPPAFMARFRRHQAEAYAAWTQARPADDFATLRPYLERSVEMCREMSGFFSGYEHVADPLIDGTDYGMRVSTLRGLFAELRDQLVPLVRAIAERPPVDDSCLRQHFPQEAQLAFGEEVIRRLGYDFERGRQDLTHHPYETKFSLGDVRITTRVREDDLRPALFGTIHESGHAMYEQGVSWDYEGTPLNRGASSGVHESQSRLWENVVGRSRGFWQFFYPRLQEVFPGQLAHVPLEDFYRAINRVRPSLIRVEADEVTYNLHIMIRFDLELALLEGTLPVKDLPEAWRARYESDLGIAPPDDRDGVLQDMHWLMGTVGGMFQGYTLGNILGAQFFAAAVQAEPGIPDDIAQGEFGRLHGWLKDKIYRHGRKFTMEELVERVTGGPLRIEPYLRYLRAKYGELYAL